MQILRCTITLHESVYYATRELGTLYETGQYLHNYALSYALFNDGYLQVPYFCNSYQPAYITDLARLAEQGIYVTPAAPLQVDFLLVTWKIGQVNYYRRSEQFGGRNYPANIGRAKELAPESTFVCYVISAAALRLPRWVRLGKWHGKALVEAEPLDVHEHDGPFVAASPLNPLDVPPGVLQAFDIVSMPPSSLVINARGVGRYYAVAGPERGIPIGLRYNVPPPEAGGRGRRRQERGQL
jgi:CRISPR-associated protein Csc1